MISNELTCVPIIKVGLDTTYSYLGIGKPWPGHKSTAGPLAINRLPSKRSLDTLPAIFERGSVNFQIELFRLFIFFFRRTTKTVSPNNNCGIGSEKRSTHTHLNTDFFFFHQTL